MTSQWETEIQTLESTVEQLEREIQRLLSHKTDCLRRLNELKASTAILPVETLSTVFEHVCSDTNFLPITLGGVSTHWREIVWSSPRLWTFIRISLVSEATGYPESYSNLLQLYFSNARSLPISIHLCGLATRVTSQRLATVSRRCFLNLIFHDYPTRIQALSLTGISSSWWDDIFRCARPNLLSALRTLDLAWSTTIRRTDHIHFSIPTLTRVTLAGHLIPLELPWKQLTCLKLIGLPIDRCLYLLFECPLLEEYQCDLPRWIHPERSEFHSILFRTDVVLPNLREFGWWFLTDGWTDFLMNVQYPSLRRLWSLASISDFHRSSIHPLPHYFIENTPNLESFSGDIRFLWRGPSPDGYTVSVDDENVDEGVSGVLSAEKLDELCVRNLDINDLRFIFDHLTICHHPAYWDSLGTLRTLSVHGSRLEQDLFEMDVFTSFVDFLQSKRSGRKIDTNECKRLTCIRLSPIDSLEKADRLSGEMVSRLETLRQLVREGLQIELVGSSGKTKLWS
ncbi:hypothetical protein P691DRAFT_782793 [Macrolepiota fuliginosa MF-IS2]|uniref:F-box domain-containing protein n=1 Tax=Macrolepiota fuliginosa MF-IS2 TaxID=1400762 RepID=A0A9P5X9Y0_9AGAR|nr:hypothetical protein P691DRAFT_782793 [Macrolepiota fuliginosa MF-IS2]